MGTFHQIAVGVVCVAGAFLFGHFLNNQTPPDKPNQFPGVASAPVGESKLILPKANEQGSTLPQFRTKSSLDFEFEQDLPPPSELGAKTTKGALETDIRSAATNELEIEVPDFSALAAQFKGTALELPALGKETLPTAFTQRDPSHAQPSSIGSGIDLPSPTVQPAVENDQNGSPSRLRDLRQQTSRFGAQQTTTPIDLPDEIGPPTPPLNHDSLTPDKIEQTFAAEAFSPKLKGDSVDQKAVGYYEGVPEIASNQQRFGSSILESSQPIGSSNAIVSYNDPFPEPESPTNDAEKFNSFSLPDSRHLGATESRVQDSQPTGAWTDRNRVRTTQQLENPSANQSSIASNKIPFGLNEENKTRLARLNRNESRNEPTTTRFNEYRTEMGDTLSKLSIKFYGKPDFYLDIYLANRDQLRNPADVPAGIILKIPVYD